MLVHVRERRPRADFWNLEREVDRLFHNFRADWSGGSATGVALSPDRDGVSIRVDVPGVEPSALNIAVDGRTLKISGERTASAREGRYRVRERRTGKFSHAFDLAEDLDVDAIDAQCRNGVLNIRIPKRPEAKPRQIEVKSN